MNQAASATRRSPADSVGATGCCPMFSAPFFGLNTNVVAPQCYLSTQAQQIVQLARQPQQLQQQLDVVSPHQQQTVSQPSTNLVGQQQQNQPQQTAPQGSQQHHLNNFSTSVTSPPGLSLQHLLANRHSASNCMALAAALATASFPHFQQQSIAPNHQQATPINQPPQTAATSTPVNSVTQSSVTLTNQVPILNYNSYQQAQPFLNLSTLTAPQQVPPVAAHLSSNSSNQHQQINSILPNNLTITTNATSNLQQTGPTRPLVANTTLNSSVDPQQTSYRNLQPQPVASLPSTLQQMNVQQQQPSTPSPAQQLGQVTRNILNDDTFNSLFNEQIQAMLLNQLLSNNQFAPLTGSATQMQSQQLSALQQPVNATSRTNTILPLASQQTPAVMTSAQQVVSAQTATSHQQASEQVSDNQQQAFNHPGIQSRVTQAQTSTTVTNDSYQSSTNSTANTTYQQTTQNHEPLIHRTSVDPTNQSAPSLQPHQQQQQQPTNIPPLPYYAIPQMESALALLTNPQVANNIFSHVFNIYLQTGLRSETHHSQHHQHQQNFHHHLHGAHHQHHHNGQNNQANGQDATMPLDSLAINESKPRGLNRAEIDSLTPYIHTNEKDPSTCVICLSKFELKSKIRPLPCNHAFHAKCVDKWLRANRSCPICRRDALKTFSGKIKRI